MRRECTLMGGSGMPSGRQPTRTSVSGATFQPCWNAGRLRGGPMEHIGEILKRQTPTSISKASTGTWSSVDPDGSSPEPVCPLCKGVRFVYPLSPSGKPDYGRVVPCRCTQEAVRENRQAHMLRYSNLGSLSSLTFDSLLPRGKSDDPAVQEQFQRASLAAKAFAEEPKGWLVFVGPSGSGKTHLAAAIGNYCVGSNRPVFYVSTPDLLDHLRSSFAPNSGLPYDELFEQVRKTPLLILDDLGIQSATPWAKEKL